MGTENNPDSKASAGGGSNQMWGGRFAAAPDALMERINASIGFDKALYAQDIAGSIAHARMLGNVGILSDADVTASDNNWSSRFCFIKCCLSVRA